MPAVHSRRLRVALWSAVVLVAPPLVVAVRDVASGDAAGWLPLVALLLIAAALGVALRRQRAFDVRARERERLDAALRASEAKFAGILSIAADAIISVDSAQRILHFNHGAETIFGYAADDVVGGQLNTLLPVRYRANHPAYLEQFARSATQARRMGDRREIFGLRRDGTEFPAEASISKLDTPDGLLFTVVLRDITARKRAEMDERFLAAAAAQLGQSLDVRETIAAIVDLAALHVADACIVDRITPTDVLERATSTGSRPELATALAELARRPLSVDSPSPAVDVLRRPHTVHVARVDGEWLEANEEANIIPVWSAMGVTALLFVPLATGDRVHGVLTLIGTNGRAFTPEMRALGEKFAAVAAAAIDNGRLYRLATDASRARDDVLGVVSHDLRNPISAIAMCARILKENPPEDAAGRAVLLDTIGESAEWIDRLIQDLLDVANIERGRLSLTLGAQDPSQLVLQARHMFDVEANAHGIVLEAVCPVGLPRVNADGARLVQALGNLLRNAVKFTPNGGRITISAVRATAGVPGRVTFVVRDTGPGIPLANQARIFERYWQAPDGARTQGTGLGLSIAKGIVDAHGGSISVESEPGRGTTFEFSIPEYAGAPSN